MASRGLSRTLWLSLAAGLLVMIVLAVAADLGATLGALRRLNPLWLPLLLAFSLGNYITRFGRWEFFLRRLGLRLPRRDSLGVFVGGFTFSVTPGKLGEVFKSVLLKHLQGAALARTAPVILAERLTDLGGLLLLATLGVYSSRQGGLAWLFGLGLLLLLLVLLLAPGLERWLLGLLARLPGLRTRGESLERALASTRALLRPRDLPLLLLLSALAWFWEGWALVFAARAFGESLPLGQALGYYSLATLLGALAFVPGGLGVTEGSLALLLGRGAGLPAGPAAAATLLIRATTLWFAVALGLLALVWLDRRWRLGARLWSGLDTLNPARDGEPGLEAGRS
ncbi:flippase-like domain-containing protein [bacterium]|nr:flippase-like domain-containing protein [bacterium]